MCFRHVVLFVLHDGVPDHEAADALTLLRALGDGEGILRWHVAESLDTRKGRILVEDATFSGPDAFAAWRSAPPHQAAAAVMSRISDWFVADYPCPDAEGQSFS